VLWRIDPLLSGDSVNSAQGQRFRKHVPFARHQILNNVTVELHEWKSGASAWSVPRCLFCMGGCEERT
jgi:hypothetical protein